MDVIMEVNNVPEAGESVLCNAIKYAPGGKGANQAVAAARLGCKTTYIGKVGNDEYGKKLINDLKHNGVDTNFINTSNESTGVAYIILEPSGQNRILVAPGANLDYSDKDLKIIENIIIEYDTVLLQLEIPLGIVTGVVEIAKSRGKKVILDAGPTRDCSIEMFKDVDIISPNEIEAQKLTGIKIYSIEEAIKASRCMIETGIREVVMKMGEKGALYVNKDFYKVIPAYRTTVVDTTAAGDAFTAALAVNLLKKRDIISSIDYANRVGALTVAKLGAQPSLPYKKDVESLKWEIRSE